MKEATQLVGMTVWTNPTNVEVSFSIRTGPKVVQKVEGRRGRVLDPGFEFARELSPGKFDTKIRIPPGGSISLPSKYDSVVQSTDATGRVVSGRAPQLLKN